MKKVVLNEELTLAFPEGFETMAPEKEASLKMVGERGKGEAVEDTERHIVASCAFKEVGTLSALLLNSKDLVKSAAKKILEAMKDFGCESEGFFTENVGGKKMEGVRYHYTAQDTAMTAETLVMKKGKVFYYLHFYYRTELREDSRKVIAEILKTAKWNA